MRRIAVGLLVLVGAAAVAFIVGMRRKSPALQNRIRAISKRRGIGTAGQAGQPNAVIHHVGRRSGRAFATQVTPYRVGDQFVVALPYTSGSDWVRNVLAADGAAIEHEGEVFRITDPRVVPYAEVAGMLPRNQTVVAKLFALDEFFLARIEH